MADREDYGPWAPYSGGRGFKQLNEQLAKLNQDATRSRTRTEAHPLIEERDQWWERDITRLGGVGRNFGREYNFRNISRTSFDEPFFKKKAPPQIPHGWDPLGTPMPGKPQALPPPLVPAPPPSQLALGPGGAKPRPLGAGPQDKPLALGPGRTFAMSSDAVRFTAGTQTVEEGRKSFPSAINARSTEGRNDAFTKGTFNKRRPGLAAPGFRIGEAGKTPAAMVGTRPAITPGTDIRLFGSRKGR